MAKTPPKATIAIGGQANADEASQELPSAQ